MKTKALIGIVVLALATFLYGCTTTEYVGTTTSVGRPASVNITLSETSTDYDSGYQEKRSSYNSGSRSTGYRQYGYESSDWYDNRRREYKDYSDYGDEYDIAIYNDGNDRRYDDNNHRNYYKYDDNDDCNGDSDSDCYDNYERERRINYRIDDNYGDTYYYIYDNNAHRYVKYYDKDDHHDGYDNECRNSYDDDCGYANTRYDAHETSKSSSTSTSSGGTSNSAASSTSSGKESSSSSSSSSSATATVGPLYNIIYTINGQVQGRSGQSEKTVMKQDSVNSQAQQTAITNTQYYPSSLTINGEGTKEVSKKGDVRTLVPEDRAVDDTASTRAVDSIGTNTYDSSPNTNTIDTVNTNTITGAKNIYDD